MKATAALLALCFALAGCSQDSSAVDETPIEPQGSDGASGGGRADQLGGWILDPALTPVVGATVSLPSENITTTTGQDGYYGFGGLDTDRILLVQVTAEGFLPLSKSITLVEDARHQLNFTIAKRPVKQAYMEKQTFTGLIGCGALVRTEDQRQPYDCSAVSPLDERVWEFNVNGDVAGIVVEASWTPDQPLAEHLNMTVETVGLGIFDDVLAEEEGPAILQAQVTRDQSQRFYRQGGTVRVTVDVGRNIEGEEAGVGVALGFQQEFQLIASVFYVAGPPPGYTSA